MSYNSEDYFLSNEFRSVLKRFEKAEADGNHAMLDSDELVDVAEYYYNTGNVKYALEIIDTALSVYPGSVAPLLFKARVALIEEKDVGMAEAYTEMIEDKADLDYYYMKAEILLAGGHAAEADEYLEKKYANVDDDDIDYFAIDTAALFLDYMDMDMAEKWLRRVDDEDLIEYKEQKARIMFEKGNYEGCKKLYNELIDKDPYSTHYWNSLASSQFFSNDIEDSIRSSEYSIAINPKNASALLNKANGLYNLGNYAEALKFYLRYNELCPNDEYGEMLIGFCLLLSDNYEGAISHLRKAEELSVPQSSNLVDIYKDWAFALCRLGRVDECLDVLDKTFTLNCDHDEMMVYRGSLLIGAGRYRESKACFMRAMSDSGNSPRIFMKIAIAVYEGGELEMAYKLFNALFSFNSRWTDGYEYLAACCYDLGKTDEFLANLKKAVEFSPKDVKLVLGRLFPENMEPADYFQYMRQKLCDGL